LIDFTGFLNTGSNCKQATLTERSIPFALFEGDDDVDGGEIEKERESLTSRRATLSKVCRFRKRKYKIPNRTFSAVSRYIILSLSRPFSIERSSEQYCKKEEMKMRCFEVEFKIEEEGNKKVEEEGGEKRRGERREGLGIQYRKETNQSKREEKWENRER
jgi:hypothetical protein